MSLAQARLPAVELFGSPGRKAEGERNYSLTVAGRPWSDNASEIKYEAPEGGESRLTFVSREPLASGVADGYEDSRVLLAVNGRPYFSGRLARPGDPDDYWRRAAAALGPFAEMAATPLGSIILPDGTIQYGADFRGETLRSALYDLARRARYPSGTIEVIGGAEHLIGNAEEAIFVEEVTCGEAATSLMGSADFVGSDVPGNAAGRRIFLPSPRPGATSKAKRVYTEDDYGAGGFKVPEEGESSYTKVVVFRRSEDGTYAVREEAPVRVEGRAVHGGSDRIHYITEFIGDRRQAKQAAYDAARRLERERPFELTVALDEEVDKFDQVEVSRDREGRDGTYRETFACMVSGGVGAEIASWSMTLSGRALRLAQEKVAAARVVAPRMSRGVVPIAPRSLFPADGLLPANDLYPH